MRLGQIKLNNEVTAAIFEGDLARPIPGHTLFDLIRRSEIDGVPLTEVALEEAATHAQKAAPIIPIQPREIWGCGGTCQAGQEAPQGKAGESADSRPGIFFKGTARVCVGPGQAIGIRADSRFTAPGPGLAVVLGSKGRILGYTLANDVSARDIGLEGPHYYSQAKTYAACCALGPVIVATDQIEDPYRLEITCTVTRGGMALFSGSASTARLSRRLETLIEYLFRSNPVPCGSVLLTGTGMTVGEKAALAPGDVVSILVPEIGELSNPAMIV